MDFDDLDYHRDIKIDPDALDVEWLDQSDLMMSYSLACDEAGKERDATKLLMDKASENIKEVKSLVLLEVRRSPQDFDVDKVTESSAAAAVEIDERVAKAKRDYYTACEKYNEAKHRFNNLYSAVKGFEHRKASLEALIRLLGMNYFSAPQVDRNLGQEYAQYRHKKTAINKKAAREKIKGRRRNK